MNIAQEVSSHAVNMVDLWSQQQVIIAASIFVITYILILSERINRAILAVLGAVLMVLFGVFDQSQAVAGIDAGTILLLLGMMIVVIITKESGLFQYVAIWSAKKVNARPMGILIAFSIITAVFSALLDNVTTVLLITPIILVLTKDMGVRPYPYLFAIILASNIGGTATLIGDPPNIMIASATGLSFNQFLFNLAPVSLVVFPLTMVPVVWYWRKELRTCLKAQKKIMQMDENAAIEDKELLCKSLFVFVLILLGFTAGHAYGLEPSTVAMAGAALLLLLDNIHHNSEAQHERVHRAIAEAEWVTLFFFAGLFILVAGIEHVGIIDWFAQHLIAATEGDKGNLMIAILWGAAIISTIVDNIPFVATMIPIVHSMAPMFGGAEGLEPIWWSLALGACLGGNGSLIGASANLVVAGFAERAGHRISFLKFMAGAFPLMILSIIIAHIYIYWRYIM